MESESVRRERRMESARGRVHLTCDKAHEHTKQSQFSRKHQERRILSGLLSHPIYLCVNILKGQI